ncbi:MAG: ferrochelatase [Bacteriovoracaceae bacterium]|jgi:ferrochelatase|nr:ferrochelatase [Halobacteriovoraceae bacterium]MDP7319238.1 ferrochelatase [Bacteriovoracaceae bacterium]
MQKKYNIVICQLGSPKTSKTSDVRSYLREFLSDPRVIDVSRGLWFFILNLFILPFRPKKSAEAYKRIEFCGMFPLIELTKGFCRQLSGLMSSEYRILPSFLLSQPRLTEVLNKSEEFYVFPQFPQFSDTTTSSVIDKIKEVSPHYEQEGKIHILKDYHRFRGFIDLSVEQIKKQLEKYPVEDLVISFHGIPVRYVTEKKDIYYQHCCETFTLLKQQLNLSHVRLHMSFQSRLGSEEWLSPYTDEYVVNLVKTGTKSVGVYCPSFVVDCLETTDEIGNELREEVEEHGGELVFIPCLNVTPKWVKSYAKLIEAFCSEGQQGAENLFYTVPADKLKENMPELTSKSTPMTPQAKRTIKIVFLTLFLDLIGFSIIFPMFPALAKHYLEIDPDNYFLKLIFGSIASFTQASGADMSSIVLFGGALGALYSLLQFFAAPLWGGLSDRFGRKPILLISLFGLFMSYFLWVFAGSFTLLILARFIGGIMGGNISTATAAIADVTDESNRSKGMAFVGIAFALGFIVGPALGGLLTIINPVEHFPSLVVYGLNPFSYPALLAAVLSLVNIFLLFFKFEETLKKADQSQTTRSFNVFKILAPLKNKNVNLTNYSYFLFISAFSGMEFTLTFLAVERLGYSSLDNAYMFIFIGFILAFVQGGFVRRKAHQIGEKKVALLGLALIIPGLLIISFAYQAWVLYFGLFFLACGSAMAIPTLTALVSLFTVASEQGKNLGIFRSLGALGRIVGPIVASLIYWRSGALYPYLFGAVFLLIPIFILKQVKQRS